MSVNATVTNIAKGSLHDGPGVRTVVYFKGCGLRCTWCHNPETLSAKKEILFMPNKCIHCGACIEVCPEHHIVQGNDMVFLRDGCTACGKCTENCPSLALAACGEEKTAAELFEELKKDAHYYASSGGGVTFSGGECLLHPDFLADIASLCKESGIHTAVESAFFVPWENIKKVAPYIDLFFADLKIPDGEKHKKFTGQDNKTIIENIRRLSTLHQHMILRIPLIPGVNDTEEDMRAFAEIIKTFGEGVKEIELLKYNHLAESKYAFVGMAYTKFAEESQTDAELKQLCTFLANECGLPCYFV